MKTYGLKVTTRYLDYTDAAGTEYYEDSSATNWYPDVGINKILKEMRGFNGKQLYDLKNGKVVEYEVKGNPFTVQLVEKDPPPEPKNEAEKVIQYLDTEEEKSKNLRNLLEMSREALGDEAFDLKGTYMGAPRPRGTKKEET